MSIFDILKKEIGGSDDFAEDVFVDTGLPSLNKAVSGRYDGGLLWGRVVEIYGASASGKTAMATNLMVNTQKMGGFAVFEDHERSFNKDLAIGFGLDVDPEKFLYKKPKTLEESFDRAILIMRKIREHSAIEDTAPITIVFDSVASMVPTSITEKRTEELKMNDHLALAKALSSHLKRIAQAAHDTNTLVVFLNQVREDPAAFMKDPTITPGGKAMEYYASVRMSLTWTNLKDKKTNAINGRRIRAKITKNKVVAPFGQAVWDFMFEPGGGGRFDVVASSIDYLKEIGILETAGAYVIWPDTGKKYHREPLIKEVEADPEMRERLFSLFPEAGTIGDSDDEDLIDDQTDN